MFPPLDTFIEWKVYIKEKREKLLIIKEGGDKLVGVMLGGGGGLVGVIGVMFGGGGVLVRVVGVGLGGGGEVVGVVGLMLGWGVDLCFLQTRVHRPIIYLNRTGDLNDIYITLTVYQYYGNYSISQPVTGLPTARVYGHISIAMIYAVQGYMSAIRNIEVSINQTLVKCVRLRATIGTLYLCPHNRDVRILESPV